MTTLEALGARATTSHRGPMPTLRVATPADAAEIDALMKASAAAIFPAFYDATRSASAARYVAQVDPALLEDGTYLVIEAGDEVVAGGGWSRRSRVYMGSADAPDDDRFLDPASEAAHIRAMFVRADWTRRGLGRRIIEASEDAARRMAFAESTSSRRCPVSRSTWPPATCRRPRSRPSSWRTVSGCPARR